MRRMFKYLLLAFLLPAVIFFLPSGIFAGSNPLTKVEYDSTDKVTFFDLVVSLNWIPTQTEKDGRLKNAFEQFGKDVFKMTEGKNKLRRLYVYTDSNQMNTADIRFKNEGGRSNAHPGGILQRGARILTYTGFSSGTARSDAYIGHTMAHEFGHYGYALFDEYVGSASSSTRPSKPLSGDTPKNTIMRSQGSYQWLSIASDYSDANTRKTAQYRVYSSSAWETLVRNPNNDTLPENYSLAYPRVRYEAFEGMTAPTSLTKPSNGWDSDFEIIWMSGTVAILVVDRSGSMGWDTPPRITYAISAAKQFVDLMKSDEKVAIVAFNSGATTLVGITELKDQAAKNAVKAQIDTLTASGGTSFSAGLNQAMSLLTAGSNNTNTRYVVLMSDGQASMPSVQSFKDDAIPVYTVGLGQSISESVLRQIASETNGTYYAAPTGSGLATVYAQITRDTVGNQQALAQDEAELSQGQLMEADTIVSSLAGTTTFRANWDQGATMSFTLRKPDGSTISSTFLPQGVSYNSGDTYAIYTVENPDTGTWKSIVSADTVTGTSTVIQEVSTSSVLSVDARLNGGEWPEPIGIMVALTTPEPVLDATVKAQVIVPSGAASVADITLLDDGIAPDIHEDDGIYSGVLGSYDVNGEYRFTIKVTNPGGVAIVDTINALEDGQDATGTSLPPFQREVTRAIKTSGVSPFPQGGDAFSAITLAPDNTLAWGAIKQNEDVMWYKFLAEAGKTYYLMTSHLLSFDQTTMATAMTLYDTDTTTEIQSSSKYQGSNISFIQWTAPETNTYYIKVAHASPGTGSFGITAGDQNISSKTAPPPAPPDDGGKTDPGDDGGGGGGGCFINTLKSIILR